MRNHQVILRKRPNGIAQADDFQIIHSVVKEPDAGQIVVRNIFLSVDPAMRGWIADTNGYAAPVPLGSVMRALAAGEVIASCNPDFVIGDQVMGWFGWQEFATLDATSVIRKITHADLPLSLSLGVLGINGVTALLALRNLGEPSPGETVLVSTAAGGVGSVVGQLAKLRGCRTVGIAGGAVKVRACLDIFDYDVALDYKVPGLAMEIANACPQGVDVYFDNTAGVISDAVMPHIALGARVVICGTSSVADWSDWPNGPRVERHLLVKRARMQGFVIFDHMDEYESAVEELAALIRAGNLIYREHVLEGLDACPDALATLYRGENKGKLLIQLG